MMTNKQHTILIVDDEEAICKLIQGILQDEGYDVDYKTTFSSAIQAFSEKQYSLCILDVWLHESSEDGILLMEECMKHSASVPIIMMSGHSTVETAVQAIKKGAYDFIEKPFKTDRLLVMVQRALELFSLKNENKNLKSGEKKYDQEYVNDMILGKGSKFEAFRDDLLNAAQSLSCTMIHGKFGTGKKTAARFVHHQSSRKDEDCIIFSCKTKKSEANVSFEGDVILNLFDHAQKGSVILDRIEFLSLNQQEQLLSFLQNNGSNIATRPRIISTCETDMKNLVSQGVFLKDLSDALGIITINVPTLEDRREDILFLIDMVYSQLKKEGENLSPRITESAQTFLVSYAWPGNMKQLKNFTEWLSVSGLDQQRSITLDDVSVYFLQGIKEVEDHTNMQEEGFILKFDTCMDVPLKEARQIFEKVYLEEQLVRFNYNISKASGFIGMERSALHRKLRSLDIKTSEVQNIKKG